MPPTVRACPPPTTITRCCGGGSTSTATMAGTHVVHAHGASCAWCMVHVHGMMSTATVGRYVRKTRRYGGSWPLQIGNALFWRREAFAYLEHEEVHLAALLAAACDEEVSSSHFGREPQVAPLSVSPSLRRSCSLSRSSLLLSPLSFSVSLSCLASVSSQPISSRPGGGGGGGAAALRARGTSCSAPKLIYRAYLAAGGAVRGAAARGDGPAGRRGDHPPLVALPGAVATGGATHVAPARTLGASAHPSR